MRVTNAHKPPNQELSLPAAPVSPIMFVPHLASDLECPNEMRLRARILTEQGETVSQDDVKDRLGIDD